MLRFPKGKEVPPATVTHLSPNGGTNAYERAVLNAVGHAIIVTDLNGDVTYWNAAAEQIYGWPAREVLGKHILDITPTNQSREHGAAIFDTLLRGETWSGEFEARDRNGRWFPVQVTDTPVKDESGRIIAIVGTSFPLPESARLRTESRDTFTARMGRQLSTKVTPDLRVDMVRSALFALLFIAMAVLLRLALDAILPARLPFITFFPFVLLIAFYCNVPVTVVGVLASAAIGSFWFDVPESESAWFRIFGFVAFVLFGGANAAVVLYLKDVLARLREKERQLGLINQELRHRMRNLFAVTSSICSRTAKYSASIAEAVSGIQSRIAAVASAQDLLGIGEQKTSDLRTLIDAVVRPLAPSPSRLAVEGPDTKLADSDILQFALVLHELSTNALKYGAWRGDAGTVAIEWHRSSSDLSFTWRENVSLSAPTTTRTGFGSDLIKRAFMGGLVEYNLGLDGLKCRITIPLPAAAPVAA